MKKLSLLFVIMAVFAADAIAQTSQGTFFAGGILGYSSSMTKNKVGSTTTDDEKNTSFTFTPAVGYMFADTWAAGIIFSYTSTRRIEYFTPPRPAPGADVVRETTTTTPIGFGVFGRKYFMINETFGFTGSLALMGIAGSTKFESLDEDGVTTSTESGLSGFSANLLGGPVWFATEHIGLEANVGILGFNSITTTQRNVSPEVSSTTNSFNFALRSFNLNFGFFYYF